jgi:hypothetical protein
MFNKKIDSILPQKERAKAVLTSAGYLYPYGTLGYELTQFVLKTRSTYNHLIL